jgi:DNA-binding PadR family transcriptional regulator
LLIVLAILKLEKDDQTTTGKDIAHCVVEYTKDHPTLYNSIYMTLKFMSEAGLVAAYYHDDLPRRRHVWKLTAKGQKRLEVTLDQIDSMRSATEKIKRLINKAA